MPEQRNKKIVHKYRGPLVYSEDYWTSLKLQNNLGGHVFFKDNENGTATLTGYVLFHTDPAKSSMLPFVMPPDGYAFTSLSGWPSGTSAGLISYDSVIYGINQRLVGGMHDATYKESAFGAQVISGALCMNIQGPGSDDWYVYFSEQALTTSLTHGNQVTIGIKRL
ncbi:hypothetical protein LZY01_19670 [Levilactobacillus zymae]|uniref:Uncharacterized protein n=1 Tax=Levilactobacillus zymae TaxID=267363 RepID=A0ABQ0WY89_9LACO|nr:hypothetical protein [Levilactobacillus zymae]QFR60997.1 hypothetical protein LZ395_05385 [Levilactobacillus zymae]GEO72799.1 hypothetical protein LZY01_19670 [Levilactobacillus zymae]